MTQYEIGELDLTAQASAAQTATNYITHIDNDGITIHPSSNTNNRTAINANGMTVYKDNVDVANFGATARIGQTGSSRFLINANSLQAYDSSNTQYFEVSSGELRFGATVAATKDDISSIDDYVRGKTYFITEDTEAVDGKIYYTFTNDEYVEASVSTGDSVTGLYEATDEESLAGAVEIMAESLDNYQIDANARLGSLENNSSMQESQINTLQDKTDSIDETLDSQSTAIKDMTDHLNSSIRIDRENGAIDIGYVNSNGEYVGYRSETSTDGFDIVSESGESVAHYGETSRVGYLGQLHIETRPDRLSFMAAETSLPMPEYDTNNQFIALDPNSPVNGEIAYLAADSNGESTFYMTRTVVVKELAFGD